jgi:hypothetical protein
VCEAGHPGRVKQQMLVVNGALEVEVGELFAQDIEKVELRAFDPEVVQTE